MGKRPFKVVIVGASLTGLTTALALETLDVDYVVLEAGIVAPTAGAAIAMQGPGCRILDQLGCYDDIWKAWERKTEVQRVNSASGPPIVRTEGTYDHQMARHGYPMIFMKRSDLLQILYDKIKHKDRILEGKRVDEVITATNGVMVKTTDGKTYTGDILVGADGMRSFVRSEMWRLAESSRPGWFPDDELKQVKCENIIAFGTTVPKLDIRPYFDFTTKHGHTYLSGQGRHGEIFWFICAAADEKKDGTDFPRYGQGDVKALVEKYGDELVTEGFTLKELHEMSGVTGATPLVEHTFAKWHYRRMVTVGDAAHLQHPISGYGGQCALESVATLINHIKPAIEAHNTGNSPLSDDDWDTLFSKFQTSRMPTIRRFYKTAHTMASIFRLEGPAKYIMPILAPISGQAGQIKRISLVYAKGTKFTHLPVPERQRAIPYLDELPAVPYESKLGKWMAVLAIAASFWLSLGATVLPDAVSFDTFAGLHPTLGSYTGSKDLDDLFTILSSFFSWVLVPSDPIPRIQCIELLATLVPAIAIWNIEANRKTNRMAPWLRVPSLFFIAAQLVTFGRAGHVYWLLSIYSSSNSLNERHVPAAHAYAVLPALCLGYILPTILMFIPFSDDALWDKLMAFWQPSPLWTGLLSILFAAIFRIFDGKKDWKGKVDEWYARREVPVLYATYVFCFAVAAVTHVSVVSYAWLEGGVPALWRLFADLPSVFKGATGITDHAEGVFVMLKYDMVFATLPMLIFLLYTVWDVRKLGYIQTSTARKVAAAVVAGQVLVGPGATYAGLWLWREVVFNSLSK